MLFASRLDWALAWLEPVSLVKLGINRDSCFRWFIDMLDNPHLFIGLRSHTPVPSQRPSTYSNTWPTT